MLAGRTIRPVMARDPARLLEITRSNEGRPGPSVAEPITKFVPENRPNEWMDSFPEMGVRHLDP